jgi:hypothetical protein
MTFFADNRPIDPCGFETTLKNKIKTTNNITVKDKNIFKLKEILEYKSKKDIV